MIKVTIRKELHGKGYLLSVSRTNPRGGATIWPGPRCSSMVTARIVARWIEDNIPTHIE